MSARDADEKLFAKTPVLKAYLGRIGARRKNFHRFVVEGDGEPVYGRIKRVVATITISGRVLTCDVEDLKPTEEETKAIAAELDGVAWPRSISATPAQVQRLVREAENRGTFFPFREQTGQDFLFVQQRLKFDDGTKVDLPWSFWSDGHWRMLEPDGDLLPLFGLELLSSGKPVMIHEGAKVAAYLQWLTSDDRDAKQALAKHPWAKELKGHVHLGWPGGAHRPDAVDWASIRRLPPSQDVALVCDRDVYGEQAAPSISSALRRSLTIVRFPHDFPSGFDLADEFPKLNSPLTMDDCSEPGTWATERVPPTGKKGKPSYRLAPRFGQEWFYVDEPPVYVHIKQRNRLRSPDTFNRIVSPFSDVTDTARLLHKKFSSKCGGVTYVPTRLADGKSPPLIMASDGQKLLNTYKPSKVIPIDGDISLWNEYFEHLIPDKEDREKVLKLIATWIATTVRTGYGLLLISELQGVGKGTLAYALIKILGEHNCKTVNESDITSSFNDWMAHTQLVIVHEIYAGHSKATYNKMKSVITDARTRINSKYMLHYDMDICCHVLACSNSLNALSLDDDDRRWLVPRVSERKMAHEFSTAFYKWLHADGPGIILNWALRYVEENGHVLAGDHAPTTTMKHEVIEAGMSDGQLLAHNIAKQVAAYPDKVVLCVRDVREWIAGWRNLSASDHRMEKQHTICKALRGGGLKEPELRQGRRPRFKINGVLSPVVANFEIDPSMEWDALKVFYRTMQEIQNQVGPVSNIKSKPPI